MIATGGDIGVETARLIQLADVVGTPAHHTPIAADPTRMPFASRHGGERSARRIQLAAIVIAPTQSTPIIADPTRKSPASRHGSERSARRIQLAAIVIAPTQSTPIIADPTRKSPASRHGSERSARRIQLAAIVIAPTQSTPIIADPTRKSPASRHGSERSARRIQLAAIVIAPTSRRSVVPDSARVRVARRNGDIAAGEHGASGQSRNWAGSSSGGGSPASTSDGEQRSQGGATNSHPHLAHKIVTNSPLSQNGREIGASPDRSPLGKSVFASCTDYPAASRNSNSSWDPAQPSPFRHASCVPRSPDALHRSTDRPPRGWTSGPHPPSAPPSHSRIAPSAAVFASKTSCAVATYRSGAIP